MSDKVEASKAKRRKRANGDGTIYQVKSGPRKGTWVGQITIGTNPKTGKPKRKSFYGRTRTEVRGKIEDYLYQISQGLDVEAAKSITFGEWLVEWLDLYKRPNIRLSTYDVYHGHVVRDIVPALGHIRLANLTTNDIQAFYAKLHRDGKAPATIQKIHQIISSCLDKAVSMRPPLISQNPAKGTERPPIGKTKVKAMPEEDMAKFLTVLEQESDKWQAAFLTLLGTGLRLGELLALEWDDINLAEGTIRVNKNLARTKSQGYIVTQPKTENSAAIVPVPDFVLQAILRHRVTQAAWILKQGDKYKNRKIVFASEKGTHMIPRNFQRKHSALIKKAGVEHVGVHALRHTFATQLLEQGENLKVVQELLRHADIKTTGNIYAHVSVKAKKQAVEKMDRLLKTRLS